MRARTAVGAVVLVLGLFLLWLWRSSFTHSHRDLIGPIPAASRDLTVGLAGQGDLNSLDPVQAGDTASIVVVWQIYDRLVDLDATGRLQPGLAAHWQSNEDLTEWRFQIRHGAFFHSAKNEKPRPVSGDDVRFSIERALKPACPAQTLLRDLVIGIADFISGKSSHVTGLTVQGETVICRLSRPFAFLPERLASSFFSIVSADTAVTTGDPLRGSGPYRVAAWNFASRMV